MGRVSAAASAAVGGAQGISLLLGGAVAAALSPRSVYAAAGMVGVVVAIGLGVLHAARATTATRAPVQRAEGPLGRESIG